MKRTVSLLVALILCAGHFSVATELRRPNIIVILADDLGFSDLGCYGGEIQTPHLDALAAGGLRFTQFYNGARCCPTRASLLTGLYPHEAGFPGMTGSLPPNAATIPEVLAAAGYRTFMCGKWHLGKPGPVDRGFEEFFGMLGGYNSYWNPRFYTRLPEGHPQRTYEAGRFYATDAITDHAIDFLAGARSRADKPFFLYLAYNAPHFPLHAPEEDIAKYSNLYAQGWDKIREARYARQKELALFVADWPLPPRSTIPPNPSATAHGWSNKQNPAWDSLPADRQADLARRMAVYAAAVDRMDQNVGRVIKDLQAHGELEHTLVFFLTDNGACAEWDPFGFDHAGKENTLHVGADLKRIGGPESYISYGSGWANASNTPLRLYKHYSYEGGIATPLIAHWPKGIDRPGGYERRIGHVADVMATCLEVAGTSYPADKLAPAGCSLVPAFRNEPEAGTRTMFFEHAGSRAVRSGTWKLVSLARQPWELYDIEADRAELNDLAAQEPERVKQLAAEWNEWAARMTAAGQR